MYTKKVVVNEYTCEAYKHGLRIRGVTDYNLDLRLSHSLPVYSCIEYMNMFIYTIFVHILHDSIHVHTYISIHDTAYTRHIDAFM